MGYFLLSQFSPKQAVSTHGLDLMQLFSIFGHFLQKLGEIYPLGYFLINQFSSKQAVSAHGLL